MIVNKTMTIVHLHQLPVPYCTRDIRVLLFNSNYIHTTNIDE